MTETQMINGCRRRDKEALRQLYEKYAGKMYAVCRRYAADKETARDLLHDGFVTIMEKISEYRGDGAFEGWMRRIFVNAALGHLRKNDALQDADNIDDCYEMRSSAPNAIQEMEASELMSCIERLPTGYRTVLNLYAIEGFSHKEIAEQLNITEETSRSQLFRAKALLQKMIKSRNN